MDLENLLRGLKSNDIKLLYGKTLSALSEHKELRRYAAWALGRITSHGKQYKHKSGFYPYKPLKLQGKGLDLNPRPAARGRA